MSDNEALLVTSLQAAVPLWIMNKQLQPWSAISTRLSYLVEMIANHGDNILFKSKKEWETAKAFNALAEGIATLSFAPGGVRIFGQHWQAKHYDIIPGVDKELMKRALEALQRRDVYAYERVKSKLGRNG